MIVVVDGASGTGKTTLAAELSSMANVPVYRPFRGQSAHITPAMVREMEDVGLLVNGWQEDLYVSDLLANVPSSVILDRALPSSLAWNAVGSDELSSNQRQTLVRLWVARMLAAKATVVLVECSENTRRNRRPLRFNDWESVGIRRSITEIATAGPSLPIWRVITDDSSPVDTAHAIHCKIRGARPISNVRVDVLRPGDLDC